MALRDLLVLQINFSDSLRFNGSGSGWKSNFAFTAPAPNVHQDGIESALLTTGTITIDDDDNILNDDNDPADGSGYSDINQIVAAMDPQLVPPPGFGGGVGVGGAVEIAGAYRLTGSDGTSIQIFELNAQPFETRFDSDPYPIFVIDRASYDPAVDTLGAPGVTYQLETPNGEPIVANNYEGDLSGTNLTYDDVVCFARGVKIDTVEGPKLVEELRAGDILPTQSGVQLPILSVERSRSLVLAKDRTVEFPAGVIGNADVIRVSPQHRMLVRVVRDFDNHKAGDLLFMPAKSTLGVVDGVRQGTESIVEYYHIVLSAHSAIGSGGVWSESFYPGKMSFKAMPQRTGRKILEMLSLSGSDSVESAYPLAFPALSVGKAQKLMKSGYLAIETLSGPYQISADESVFAESA